MKVSLVEMCVEDVVRDGVERLTEIDRERCAQR
jgi:hypothetical protein